MLSIIIGRCDVDDITPTTDIPQWVRHAIEMLDEDPLGEQMCQDPLGAQCYHARVETVVDRHKQCPSTHDDPVENY